MLTIAYNCLQMPIDALQSPKMPTNAYQYPQMPSNAHKYQQTPTKPTNAFKCLQMRTRVVELSIYLARIVENTLKCLKT